MAEFEVKIYQIDIVPHPNADALELGVIGDYRSCVRKGDYTPGQLVAYIPEGSIVPDGLIEEMGLTGRLAGSKHNRVKAVKLRGVLSQGLVYPMADVAEGEDVTERLGITKYAPPIPTSMSGEVWNAHGRTLRYEIENIKKWPLLLREGETVSITEKLHGTWCCLGLNNGEPIISSKGVSARGLAFKVGPEDNLRNLYVKMWRQYESTIREVAKLVGGEVGGYVLGEIYGPGVQDLKYGEKKAAFRVFDIYAGEPPAGRFLSAEELRQLTGGFDDLELVPSIYDGPYWPAEVSAMSQGQTTLGGGHVREGVVVRPIKERDDDLAGRVILKSVNEKYLLRKGGTEYN